MRRVQRLQHHRGQKAICDLAEAMVDHVKTKMDVAYLPAVEGSMTSADSQAFMLHVKRPTGAGLLLGLPA